MMEPVFSLKHIGGKGKKNTSTGSTAFPSTAYDYLKRVQNEAALCPDIVVANMDCSVFDVNQDSNYTAVEPIKTSNGDKAPSQQWQNEQVSSFAELRQLLVHRKALLKTRIQMRKLPAAENESQWFEFCLGKQQEKDEEHFSSQEENKSSHNMPEKGTPALLSVILQMNQSTVLAVLDHHISWLETQPFCSLQGQWIYALLTAVEKPLHPDTTYSLRTLARLCSKQKENLAEERTKELAALYLIIIIVIRYFGQSDLAHSG